jgi:iron(III) transport system permease protein
VSALTVRRERRRSGSAPSPALAVAGVIVAAAASLPLAYLLVRAGSGGAAAWSVLGRPETVEVVARTIALVAVVTAAATAIGAALAWLVERTDLPLRRFWAVAAALPLAVPSYVAALALLAAVGPGGALSQALPGSLRAFDITGFPGAALALTLSTYPYVYLLGAAALRRADPALEEAARGLGRSRLAVLREVTLPLARPALGAGALLAALYSLSDFGVVSLMRLDVLTRVIFQQYRTLFDRTPAAVLGLVLVVLTIVVLVLEARARGRSAPRAAPAGARRVAPTSLGRWRPVATAFCGLVVGLALALPLGVLAYWIVRGGPAGAGVEAGIVLPAAGSLAVSLVAGAAAVLAALPIALLVVRTPRRWTRALERVAYGANALPGVVVALALVFFAARYLGALYQTLALLVFAYVVRFLPQALAGARTALAGVNPRLEEAARALGRGPRSAFAAVTVPLAAPGLLAGATIVFLSTMKELPVTLLLRPIGFETLATEVWSATSVSAYSRAAPAALLLVAVSAPIVVRMVARRDGRGTEAEALGAG